MKIGLYFGSFNPVHVGHMIIANYMLAFAELDRLWFIVSPHNPLKTKSSLLADHHRLELVHRAIGDNNKMKASNIEFKLPQPSYTIHTLAYLSEKFPNDRFALIMGSDNLSTLHKWKNYEEILKQYEVLVYPRPESDGGPLKAHPHVKMVNAPLVDISSTFIREAVKNKKDVRYYLPHEAWEYMREMHFYEK
ncbi:MAG: nicotinate-nucleotide adenylyltransferase [Bacteroidetes bacterium]|nr:MAG: nicotinate-nucleotide adenylyltransferase [Bacteroidota bacterium]